MLHPTRRCFLQGLLGGAALVPSLAHAEDPKQTFAADVLGTRTPVDFKVLDLEVDGDRSLARRFALFIPNHLGKDERVPLLVLLHGLGETWDTTVGIYAWVERYGLGSAYARLRRPPVERTSRQKNLMSDALLASINADVAAQPFRGMVIACPYTPNIPKSVNPDAKYDTYAAWIADVVIPRARKEAPMVKPEPRFTALDGVSLGGAVGIEVLIRRPEAFGCWGSIQGAFNPLKLQTYVDRIGDTLGKRPKAPKASIRIATTESDPFRAVNTTLVDMLGNKGIGTETVLRPGLHDQVFLRETATLEMLLWYDRRLR